MRLLAVAVPLTALCTAACTDAAMAPPPDATWVDAAVLPTCGPGPYVRLQTGVIAFGTNQPIAGATTTVDECPGMTFVADDNGRFDVHMTKDVPVNGRVDATGYLPLRSSTFQVSADLVTPGGALMFSTSLVSLLPHWSKDAPDILAIVFPPPGTKPDPNDACTTRDGAVFSVKDHPEAVVTYYMGGGGIPAPDPTLTATTTVGAAEISNLSATAPGAPVELEVTKTGCATVSFKSPPHLGLYQLENGVLTEAGAFTKP